MKMQTKLCSLVIAMALFGVGCKDSPTTSSSTPAPAPAPDPAPSVGASQASIVVGVSNASVTPATGGGSNFNFSLGMTESAGVGSRINFVRLDIFRATGAFEERSEIGSGAIIAGAGDNRLDGNSTETASVTMLFRATIKKGRQMLLTVGFTDDNGNDLEATFPFIFT